MDEEDNIILDTKNGSEDSPLIEGSSTEKRENLISAIIIGTVLFAALLALIFGIIFRYSDVDYIVVNAKVHTMLPTNNKTFCCFAVKSGKFDRITETEEELYQFYKRPKKVINAQQASIFPGFIDSHAHLISLGLNSVNVNLNETKSVEEIIKKIQDYIKEKEIEKGSWIQGFGWDQTLWEDTNFPTRFQLDPFFPDNPIWLERIDGHAGWSNSRALDDIAIPSFNITGGEVIRFENGTVTGIFIDKAMELVTETIPPITKRQIDEAIKYATEECKRYGITSIHDAGVLPSVIERYKVAIDRDRFDLRVYAMLEGDPSSGINPSKDCNFKKLDRYGDKLTVSSVKLYMDGALGSRGAALLEPYSDDNTTNGLLFRDQTEMNQLVIGWANCGFQVNTHAIGDHANNVVLNSYINYFNTLNQSEDEDVAQAFKKRFRIEHAQVIEPTDVERFSEYGIIPSIQPAHATSDMRFALERLGPIRLNSSYLLNTFLEIYHSRPDNPFLSIPFTLGSDFPVDVVNPLISIHSAVTRQNTQGMPEGGWLPEQKISIREALFGFTYYPAFAAFQENYMGSISEGNYADYIVLNNDITLLEDEPQNLLNTYVVATFLGGRCVFHNTTFTESKLFC